MSTDLIEMEVKSIGKKVEYTKPNGVTTSRMCSVKTKDQHGIEHKAYALGNLCDKLKVGNRVLATKWVSPKKEDNINRFMIVKSLKKKAKWK